MNNYNNNWEVDITRNHYLTSARTWKDVSDCIRRLSELGELFLGLHRAEGGFACIEGPDFRSTENEYTNEPVVRKAIRFRRFGNGRLDWPSCDRSFASVEDDHTVIPDGMVLSLRFEGQNCRPWSKKRCREMADVIAAALCFRHIHANSVNRHILNRARVSRKPN